jgi:hypothetical protein
MLFAASKLVETALHNSSRIACCWETILPHLLMLANHKVTESLVLDRVNVLNNRNLESEILELILSLKSLQLHYQQKE